MSPLPDIRRLRAYLKRGGVIAYPTESCYGLGCDPSNRRAVQRILKLKVRPQRKGLILVGSDIQQFKPYLAKLPDTLVNRLDEWWPGPNTLLLPTSKRCPPWLKGRHTKLAVRISAHPETARLSRALNMALVSTSANAAGKHAIKDARTCRQRFGQSVLLLPGRIGQRKRPSRIFDPISGLVFRA
jgi:L-threonylcarbamoyladenylate synthase